MSLDKLLKLQAQKLTAETSTAVESSTPAPTSVAGKLPFGQKSKPTEPTEPKATRTPVSAPASVDFDLDNLGSVDMSLVTEVETGDEVSDFSGFIDEIEATAPDRELPEDATAGMRDFVENLDSIYLILNDTEMFGQSVRTIMMELQENPEYEKLISDTDVHVMIRAMRNTMGLARVKKQSKQRKVASGKTRTPSKKQALMDKALGLSIGMDID